MTSLKLPFSSHNAATNTPSNTSTAGAGGGGKINNLLPLHQSGSQLYSSQLGGGAGGNNPMYSSRRNMMNMSHISSRIVKGGGGGPGGGGNSKGSRKGKKHLYQHDIARIYDKYGNDVTPIPLHNTQQQNNNTFKPTTGGQAGAAGVGGGVGNIATILHHHTTSHQLQQHHATARLLQTQRSVSQYQSSNLLMSDVSRGNIGEYYGSNMNGSSMNMNHAQIVYGDTTATGGMMSGMTTTQTQGQVADHPQPSFLSNTDYATKEQQFLASLQEMQSNPVTQKRVYTEAELQERITIELSEGDTVTLFHQQSSYVYPTKKNHEKGNHDDNNSSNDELVERVVEENSYYNDLIHDRKDNSQQFHSTHIQTINNTTREKEIQVTPPLMYDVGVDVHTYDIYDTYYQQHDGGGAGGVGNSGSDGNHHTSNEYQNGSSGSSGGGGGMIGGSNMNGENGYNGGGENYSEVSGYSTHSATMGGGYTTVGGGGMTTTTATTPSHSMSIHSSGSHRIPPTQSHLSGTTDSTNTSQYPHNTNTTSSRYDMNGSNGNNAAVSPSWHTISQYEMISKSGAFYKACTFTEQAVLNNIYYGEQLLYRDIMCRMEDIKDVMGINVLMSSRYDDQQHTASKENLLDLHRTHLHENYEKNQDHHINGSGSGIGSDAHYPHSHTGENLTDKDLPLNTPRLQWLWGYRADTLTSGMYVNTLCFHPINHDLLAAGYGSSSGSGKSTSGGGGLISFWSLKNMYYPHRIYYTTSSVTSLHFSTSTPYLLGVGYEDGNISIYDIRTYNYYQPHMNKPILQSNFSTGKHHEPVIQVKWVHQVTSSAVSSSDTKTSEREPERDDTDTNHNNVSHDDTVNQSSYHTSSSNTLPQYLVSISTDGIIYQWNLKKGIIPTVLMKLKRNTTANNSSSSLTSTSTTSNSTSTSNSSSVSLTRESSGLCFDFSLVDHSSTYICGTEDGLIHKCSVSYNEQTLESYIGHTGPVYNVVYNKYVRDVFLSCSGDWTCMLWSHSIHYSMNSNVQQNTSICKFTNGHDAIMDVQWSPYNSTVFAYCTQSGRVDVWDLQYSSLDPIISIHTNKSLTSIRFSQNMPTLSVGDRDGNVYVYRIHHVDILNQQYHYTDLQQAERLETILVNHCESQQRLQTATQMQHQNNNNNANMSISMNMSDAQPNTTLTAQN